MRDGEAGVDDVELVGERGRVTIATRDWPVLCVRVEGLIDPELTQQWHDAYTRIIGERNERYVYVIDGTLGGELPATSRRVIADYLAKHQRSQDPMMRLHVGSLYVLPSALLRGVATAVFWIQQPKYRWKFAATLSEAERAAKEWLRAEGIDWAGLRR